MRVGRVVSLSLVWAAVQGALGGYMHGASIGQMASNHLPMGALFFLAFLVFAVNPLLSRVSPNGRLNAAELTVVWAMTTAASAVPGYGLMEFLFPYLASPLYYSTPENQWAEAVLPHLKEWLYVSDLKAAEAFFEGVDDLRLIPWGAWLKPAAFGIGFGLLFFFAVGCWAAILRRQWSERERYSFPLVQVAQQMTQTDPSGRAYNATFRSTGFWIAALCMVVLHGLRGLHRLDPSVPSIPVIFSIRHLFPNPPWNALVQGWPLWPRIYFSVIGVTYFLRLDVSLSLWFFFAFYKFQQVFFRAFAVTAVNTQNQVMGAVVVLALFSAWQARRHLTDVVKKALNPNDRSISDADEPLSYRGALAGTLLGLGGMALMCVWAGMSLWMTIGFLTLLWILATAAAWYVSNAGLLLVNVGFSPHQFFLTMLGARRVGARNLAFLAFERSSIPHWSSESLMPYAIQNFRLTEAHGLSARPLRLGRWMCLAVLVAVAAAFVSTMFWTHAEGALNFEGWIYRGLGPFQMNKIARSVINPQPPNGPGVMSAAAGGGVMAFLLWMRHRFLWWPFHPIGYALGVTWAPFHLWFSTLLGWALKLTLLKFGGFGLYRRTRPVFIGLILGEYVMAALWAFIGLKTGVSYWGLPH